MVALLFPLQKNKINAIQNLCSLYRANMETRDPLLPSSCTAVFY